MKYCISYLCLSFGSPIFLPKGMNFIRVIKRKCFRQSVQEMSLKWVLDSDLNWDFILTRMEKHQEIWRTSFETTREAVNNMVSPDVETLVCFSALLREELESLLQDAPSSQSVSKKKGRGDKAGCCSNSREICSKGYSPACVMPPPPPGVSRMLPGRLRQRQRQRRRCLALSWDHPQENLKSRQTLPPALL